MATIGGDKETMDTIKTLGPRIAACLLRTRFVREAWEEKADLSGMRSKPTSRVKAGLVLMAFSYVIGWPAVGLLAWIALRMREPLIIVIGGPVTYVLSNIVFMTGSYLAGAHYAKVFLRWATRRLVERLAGVIPPEAKIDYAKDEGH